MSKMESMHIKFTWSEGPVYVDLLAPVAMAHAGSISAACRCRYSHINRSAQCTSDLKPLNLGKHLMRR